MNEHPLAHLPAPNSHTNGLAGEVPRSPLLATGERAGEAPTAVTASGRSGHAPPEAPPDPRLALGTSVEVRIRAVD